MRLPLFFQQIFGFSTKREYFLTLILRDDIVKAVVYEKLEGRIKASGRGMEALSKPIDDLSIDELLEICDRVIVQAEEFLPASVEVHKTIFGIKEDWQTQEKISSAHLEKLKRLKVDLELIPLGFVVVSDAISYSLAREEGAPINSILVELGKHTMGVSFIRATRIAENKTVPQTTDPPPLLIENILKGFSSFEVLPSRIILFDGEKDLEKVRQACIAHPFTKNLPFLHAPRIEILPPDVDEKAVVAGIATEMGLNLSEEAGPAKGPLRSEASGAGKKEREVQESTPSSEEKLAFGFIKDQDIGTIVKTKEDKTKTRLSLRSIPPLVKKLQDNLVHLPWRRLPSISVRISIPTPGRIMLIPIVLTTASVLYILSYLVLPKAGVEVIVSPKIIEEERDIIIDPNAKESTEEQVKGTIVSVAKEGSKTAKTSGKKEVGEKAKGSVKIGNTTTTSKTFAKGTVLVGPNSLRLELLDSVSIASRSAGSFEIPSSKGEVQALQIGEESNLPGGTSLTFLDSSQTSYFATTDSTFTGGSKREITVVTKNDQDSLLKTLSEELRSGALDEIAKEEEGISVIRDIVSEKVLEKTFDKKVDEEAPNLTLKTKIEFQGLAYNEQDLREIFGKRFKDRGETEGLLLSQDGLEITVKSFKKQKDGSIEAHVASIALFVPRFAFDEIKTQIAFKSAKEASEYLKTLPNVADVTIQVSPVFPFLPPNLPLRTDHIEITITAKE